MKWIHTKLTQIIISSEIIVYLIVRILFYKSPKIHLNNTSIDNDDEKYGCKIKTPKYCQYKLFSSIQDYTKILGINCRIAKSNSKKNLLKKIKSNFIIKK